MKKLKTLWGKLPNWAKAGVNTGWQSAGGTFVLALVGWAHDVQESFDNSVQGDFPSVSPLGKAGLAVLVGVFTGLMTAVYRRIKPGPTYHPPGD